VNKTQWYRGALAVESSLLGKVGEGDSAWKTWQYQLQYVEPQQSVWRSAGLISQPV
jgi:hypothetical protein